MPSASYGQSLSLGGVSIQQQVTITFDHPNTYQVILSAGKTLTSWVKTSASVGAGNLPSGHGYTDGNFDVFWESGGVLYSRYGVPGTITTNAIALSGGDGTDFPASATTGMTICKQVQINTAIDGDACQIFGVVLESSNPSSSSFGHIDFQDSGNNSIFETNLDANVPRVFNFAGGDTNVLTGNAIAVAFVSNGATDTDEVVTIKILSGEDSTP